MDTPGLGTRSGTPVRHMDKKEELKVATQVIQRMKLTFTLPSKTIKRQKRADQLPLGAKVTPGQSPTLCLT